MVAIYFSPAKTFILQVKNRLQGMFGTTKLGQGVRSYGRVSKVMAGCPKNRANYPTSRKRDDLLELLLEEEARVSEHRREIDSRFIDYI